MASAAEPLRLCAWSGPRNLSTALMYSFAQRADTRVVDEPLYAHYLRVTGADHPLRDEVLAAQENDGEKVVRELVLGPCDRPVFFQKQMAHHLAGLDRSFLKETTNVLLIRDPEEAIPSLETKLRRPKLQDTAVKIQAFLYKELRGWGEAPIVVDAGELRKDPRSVLEQLCGRCGIEFVEDMLHWPPGPRPEDGTWASYWYGDVHRSTGFMPYMPRLETFPQRLWGLLERARPYYEYLRKHAITASSPA